MKLIYLCCTLLLISYTSVYSQHFLDDKKLFTAKVKFVDDKQEPTKAFLYATTDSSLLLTTSVDFTDLLFQTVPITELLYSEIDKITIWEHRKMINTAAKTGALAGAACGGFTFLIFAAAGNSEEVGSPLLYAFAAGIMAFVPGFITGGIIGYSRKRFDIYGSDIIFREKRKQFAPYAYKLDDR